MFGGFGSMQNAIVVIRNNKKLRHKRTSFKEISDQYTTTNKKVTSKKKTFTKEQKLHARKLNTKVNARNKNEILVYAIVGIICIAFVIYALIRFTSA